MHAINTFMFFMFHTITLVCHVYTYKAVRKREINKNSLHDYHSTKYKQCGYPYILKSRINLQCIDAI